MHITTKFTQVNKLNTDDGFVIVKKADNDTIFEIIKYRYDKPFTTSYTLSSVEYISLERAIELDYV